MTQGKSRMRQFRTSGSVEGLWETTIPTPTGRTRVKTLNLELWMLNLSRALRATRAIRLCALPSVCYQ
jgi:hypothetical protein